MTTHPDPKQNRHFRLGALTTGVASCVSRLKMRLRAATGDDSTSSHQTPAASELAQVSFVFSAWRVRDGA